jgi:hypothetical protein
VTIKSYGWTRCRDQERALALKAPAMAAASNVLHVWEQDHFRAIVGHERIDGLVGTLEDGWRWHLSLSHRDRYVTWDELKAARYGLIPDGAWMVQVLPPAARYHSLPGSLAFHLWEIPEAYAPVMFGPDCAQAGGRIPQESPRRSTGPLR